MRSLQSDQAFIFYEPGLIMAHQEWWKSVVKHGFGWSSAGDIYVPEPVKIDTIERKRERERSLGLGNRRGTYLYYKSITALLNWPQKPFGWLLASHGSLEDKSQKTKRERERESFKTRWLPRELQILQRMPKSTIHVGQDSTLNPKLGPKIIMMKRRWMMYVQVCKGSSRWLQFDYRVSTLVHPMMRSDDGSILKEVLKEWMKRGEADLKESHSLYVVLLVHCEAMPDT